MEVAAVSGLVRGAWRVTASALALTLLAACGDGGNGAVPADPATPSASAAADGFPVTVTHGQGSVTIERPPERVVTLGWGDAQIASALGAPIVGATRNPYTDDGNWPGMREPLPPDVAVLDSVTPEVEKIAALEPDLILMTSAQPTFVEVYEELSAIAPVVSYQTALLQDPGDELTRLIGSALGRVDEAEELIATAHQQIADFAAELPGLAGKKIVFGQYYQEQTGIIVTADSPSVTFFGRLGLVVPDELAELADSGTPYGTVQLSSEQLELLDHLDVAFINSPAGAEEFTSLPVVPELELVESGNLHFTSDDLASFLLTPNPAVTGALLEEIREPLTKVADE